MLAKTYDRYGISDRAAAAIVSSVLHDISSYIEVVDKSKICRERKKKRNELILLLSMLSDENRILRELAARSYLKHEVLLIQESNFECLKCHKSILKLIAILTS